MSLPLAPGGSSDEIHGGRRSDGQLRLVVRSTVGQARRDAVHDELCAARLALELGVATMRRGYDREICRSTARRAHSARAGGVAARGRRRRRADVIRPSCSPAMCAGAHFAADDGKTALASARRQLDLPHAAAEGTRAAAPSGRARLAAQQLGHKVAARRHHWSRATTRHCSAPGRRRARCRATDAGAAAFGEVAHEQVGARAAERGGRALGCRRRRSRRGNVAPSRRGAGRTRRCWSRAARRQRGAQGELERQPAVAPISLAPELIQLESARPIALRVDYGRRRGAGHARRWGARPWASRPRRRCRHEAHGVGCRELRDLPDVARVVDRGHQRARCFDVARHILMLDPEECSRSARAARRSTGVARGWRLGRLHPARAGGPLLLVPPRAAPARRRRTSGSDALLLFRLREAAKLRGPTRTPPPHPSLRRPPPIPPSTRTARCRGWRGGRLPASPYIRDEVPGVDTHGDDGCRRDRNRRARARLGAPHGEHADGVSGATASTSAAAISSRWTSTSAAMGSNNATVAGDCRGELLDGRRGLGAPPPPRPTRGPRLDATVWVWRPAGQGRELHASTSGARGARRSAPRGAPSSVDRPLPPPARRPADACERVEKCSSSPGRRYPRTLSRSDVPISWTLFLEAQFAELPVNSLV